MSFYPPGLQRLMDALAKLPGVGPKTAQRLAFYLLEQNPDEVKDLAEAIGQLQGRVHFCPRCFNIAEDELCVICSDPKPVSYTHLIIAVCSKICCALNPTR